MVPKLAAKGTSFKGAAAYYLHDKGASTNERVAWTATHNLATDNPEMAWRIMAATAKDQARLKDQAGIRTTGRKSTDVVLAYSLAWHPDEKDGLTREEMLLAAHASIKALGADHCQAIIVAHNDEPHPHVHVILNRVSPEDGRMLSSSKEKLNLSKWAQAYETARGKVYCEQRVANNEARDMLGEFTRAAKDKPRHRYDEDQALGQSRPGDSHRVSRIRDEQREKDAALAQKGRDMHVRHRAAWVQLGSDHRDRRTAIRQTMKRELHRARADMKASALPLWQQIHKRHFAEQRLFKEREQRVTGKIKNAIAAIKSMGAVRGENTARGFLGTAFNYLTSAAKRCQSLLQRQEGEKRAFATQQRRKAQERASELRSEQSKRLAANTGRLDKDRKALRTSQDGERHALKSEWRERNKERGDTMAKISAARDFRRQIAERFKDQDRSRGGRDRGR
jgi:hypothetical protein